MPLTNEETLALSDFLNNVDSSFMCRLGASVTQGAIQPTSREDAYNCVMLHTDSLFQLLNLKRVNTAVLLKYLHHLHEPVNGHATKEEILQKLYQKWNLPYPSKNVHYAPPLIASSSNQCTQVLAPFNNSCHYGPVSVLSTNASGMQMNDQFQMMFEAARMTNADPLSQMVRSKEVLKEINSMAFNEYIVGFAQTFYSLLNNAGGGQWLHGFNDTHFFGECKLKIMIKGASEDVELEGEGINEVLLAFSQLKEEHQLYFSPNLTEKGVCSKQDRHGLISAAVCGTLHQRSGPVGVFEQYFVLSADPFSKDTYKILETVLILRSSNAVSSMTELMLTTGRKNDKALAIEEGNQSREGDYQIVKRS